MKKATRDNLIVWTAFAAMVGVIIWLFYLCVRAIDWIEEMAHRLSQEYVTPCGMEWAVVLCAATCIICLLINLFSDPIMRTSTRHPVVNKAITAIGASVVCWMIYLFSNMHESMRFLLPRAGWLLVLIFISVGLEKGRRIAYVCFFVFLLLTFNDHFMLLPMISVMGIQTADIDILDKYHGLVQCGILSYAALLLITPAAFKWMWLKSERANALLEEMGLFGKLGVDAQGNVLDENGNVAFPPETK